MKPITIQEKTFFLAEAEKPEDDRKRRIRAINLAIGESYKIRSALDEKQPYAFTCKICEMIQTCAYGIADISERNPNVLLELGMMIALGKPTIILLKQEQDEELELFSDLKAIEIIPFTQYIDIIDPLKEVTPKLPPPVSPPSPIEDIKRLQPQFARQLRQQLDEVVEEFKKSVEEAKLDTISLSEEKKEISPELGERLTGLEEKLEDMRRLGFVTDARTAFLRGNYFYNQGKYDEALANYNWSLELQPDDPAILDNRGNTYQYLERYDEALADYNHSLELRPDYPETLNNRGHAYHKLDKYYEAIADFTRALELKPDYLEAFYNRGTVYAKLEKYDEALADFNRALEITPNHHDTLINRGIAYAKLEKYDEALADYNCALELSPDDPNTLYNLACLFSLKRQTDDALSYLEKAIDKDKKYREMARTDKDFDNIRDNSRFKKLIE